MNLIKRSRSLIFAITTKQFFHALFYHFIAFSLAMKGFLPQRREGKHHIPFHVLAVSLSDEIPSRCGIYVVYSPSDGVTLQRSTRANNFLLGARLALRKYICSAK